MNQVLGPVLSRFVILLSSRLEVAWWHQHGASCAFGMPPAPRLSRVIQMRCLKHSTPPINAPMLILQSVLCYTAMPDIGRCDAPGLSWGLSIHSPCSYPTPGQAFPNTRLSNSPVGEYLDRFFRVGILPA